jgi:signal peptide peptidase SppA
MSDQPVRRVSRFVRNHPWAITRDKLDAICEVIDARMRGIALTDAEIKARIGAVENAAAPQRRETSIVNAVAIIPLYGVLAQRMNMMTAISGGTSMEQFLAQVSQAVADETVKGIIIDCDSPGGTVDGCIETADALFALRGKKPIVAVANPVMASAAYWLMAQCDEIVGTPSAHVGSIGVFTVHDDESAANEKAGYKPTYIYAGDHKVEMNSDEPLSDEARAFVQSQINARYTEFIKAIARGRGVSASVVKNDFGQGRTLFAKDALAAKMIDRIGTLDDTIARLMGRRAGVSRAAALGGAGGGNTGDAIVAVIAGAAATTSAASCEDCGPECPCELEECDPDCPTCDETCACRAGGAKAAVVPATSDAALQAEQEAIRAVLASTDRA